MERVEPGAEAALLSRWVEAMRRGDFESAWRETDRQEQAQRQSRGGARSRLKGEHLVWDGSALEGRRVLVRCEHGLGDTIQFARYFPSLGRQANRLLVKAQPQLLGLLRGQEGIDELLDGWSDQGDPDHDVAIECMELAYAFRSTVATLPARVPYLPVARITNASRFLLRTRPNIGLLWASSSWDPRRSICLSHLELLRQFSRLHFYSLQQGAEAVQSSTAPFPLHSLSPWTAPIEQAAAAMLQMDLIIAVDGMPAHLAGALGRPVWLLLPFDADWRWMGGSLSPWYPTMRIFRQPSPGDWVTPIRELAVALSAMRWPSA